MREVILLQCPNGCDLSSLRVINSEPNDRGERFLPIVACDRCFKFFISVENAEDGTVGEFVFSEKITQDFTEMTASLKGGISRVVRGLPFVEEVSKNSKKVD